MPPATPLAKQTCRSTGVAYTAFLSDDSASLVGEKGSIVVLIQDTIECWIRGCFLAEGWNGVRYGVANYVITEFGSEAAKLTSFGATNGSLP
jgi:hypothetical protein